MIKGRAVRIGGALITAALLSGFAAPQALAEDGTTKKAVGPESTTCSNQLVKSGSGTARLSVSGDSYVDADISSATIQTSHVRATVTSCSGTGDNGVSTSKITVNMKWIVNSTGVGSCSFGVPSGVSCTVDAKETIITRSWTCTNTSSCSKTFEDNLRPKPKQNYKILNVTFEVSASAQQSGRDKKTVETDAATWGA